jgi:hypothetical protein
VQDGGDLALSLRDSGSCLAPGVYTPPRVSGRFRCDVSLHAYQHRRLKRAAGTPEAASRERPSPPLTTPCLRIHGGTSKSTRRAAHARRRAALVGLGRSRPPDEQQVSSLPRLCSSPPRVYVARPSRWFPCVSLSGAEGSRT